MWGRTIQDMEGADLATEVQKTFSSKPCLRDISSHTYNETSKKCLRLTKEQYGSLTPALCQACKKSSGGIKAEESLDHHMELEETFVEPKAETDFDSHCQGETAFEDFTEGNFPEGEGEHDVKEEDVSKVCSNDLPDEDLETGGNSRHKCDFCDDVFVKKNFKCGLCEYAASEAGNLKRHVLAVHNKVKNFKCELCEYAASQSGTLKQHVRAVHAKEKNFKCELCEYEASKNGHLKVHVRAVHAKEKNFKCKLCEYAASRPEQLKQHVLSVHDKVKNFKCELCEYAASQNGHLKKHVRAIHAKGKTRS